MGESTIIMFSKKETKKFNSICHPDTCPTCGGFDCVERDGKWIACPNKSWCGAKYIRPSSFILNDGTPIETINPGISHCSRKKHKKGKHRSGKFEW
jgi:hypothetical protein